MGMIFTNVLRRQWLVVEYSRNLTKMVSLSCIRNNNALEMSINMGVLFKISCVVWYGIGLKTDKIYPDSPLILCNSISPVVYWKLPSCQMGLTYLIFA